MRTAASRSEEQGMILLNVLVIVAIASAAVVLMISTQDVATQRSTRFSEASRALAVARGGELSAITALRRDALQAPQTDNLSEPWAAVAQTDTPIEGGRFSLSITDAQARFNVNSLMLGGIAAEGALRDLCVAAQARQTDCDRLIAYIRLTGPLTEVLGLAEAAGVDPAVQRRLEPLITALPTSTTVNLNTAPELLLGELMRNPAAARALVGRRQGKGYLTEDDLRSVNAVLSPALGFTSDYFWVETRVTIGETPQVLRSLIRRGRRDGAPEVVTVSRKKVPAAPTRAPPA